MLKRIRQFIRSMAIAWQVGREAGRKRAEDFIQKYGLYDITMLSSLIGLVGVLTALIGWYGYKSVLLLTVGTGLYVVETLLEWKNLNMNAKKLDLFIFAGGSVVALFTNLPFYIGGMLAINFYSALMTLFALPALIAQIVLFITIVFRK